MRNGLMGKLGTGRGVGQDSILEVRVVLLDSVPEIWRLLEIRSPMALDQVHEVLQLVFGWEDAHLHRFTTGDPFAPLRPVDGEIPEVQQWLPGQECEEQEDRPEEDCTLDEMLVLGSGGAFYEYDFGDSWLHRLELVSRRPADEDSAQARLIDGARRGPLENSGGFPGYEEIMDALADPSHPVHAQHSGWVAGVTGSRYAFRPCLPGHPRREPGAGQPVLTPELWLQKARHITPGSPIEATPPPIFKRL
jgi:hypothetical protein